MKLFWHYVYYLRFEEKANNIYCKLIINPRTEIKCGAKYANSDITTTSTLNYHLKHCHQDLKIDLKQPELAHVFKKTKEHPQHKMNELHLAVAECVVLDSLPFNMLHGKVLKDLSRK
ncbi:11835_t:CDS:2 [Entrophospora sp. SA101]|nr:11835_t:CDS:2 [Entrophospora sp. SA101]CAJ0895190.1 4724_t:CDS:2 [Entrophospora sp. SA101]